MDLSYAKKKKLIVLDVQGLRQGNVAALFAVTVVDRQWGDWPNDSLLPTPIHFFVGANKQAQKGKQ